MPRTRFFPNFLPDIVNVKENRSQQTSSINWTEQISSIVHSIVDALPRISNSDGGLYVGNAGIAYMLYHVTNFQPLAQNRNSYLSVASKLYEQDTKFHSKAKSKDAVSFILGAGGVFVLGALLGKAMNDKKLIDENVGKYQSLAKTCIEPHFLSCGSDELFVGRAGYLCGALKLEKELGFKVLDDDITNAICTIMVKSGKEYSRQRRSPSPLMYAYYGTEYLGAAHGLSAILQMLISCPSFLQADEEAANEIKASIDWMLSLQQDNGNFAPSTEDLKTVQDGGRHSCVQKPLECFLPDESEQLIHWCHGAPGVVYLLAKAYKVWGDEKYLAACLRCGEVTWRLGLLKKGPGICHGVAGSGYVFLLLYRLTGDQKHLHRAQQFANFLFTQEFQSGARTPDCPYSLYEGWAGTVCFLIDLQQPNKAEFPFFDIF